MTQPKDTPQQRVALRTNEAARKVRKRFPAGTRVTAAGHDTGLQGTVTRHVPGMNAQGGHLTVLWDNGTEGRHSAVALRPIHEGEQ